jgi:hypothetical protein
LVAALREVHRPIMTLPRAATNAMILSVLIWF